MSDSTASSDGRLARAAQSLAALARRLTGSVAVLAGTSAGAGLLLWGLLWWPVPLRLLPLLGAAATLGVLLAPAAVLGLFYQGLRDLGALPARLSEHTTRTVERSGAAAESITADASGRLGRLWRLVKEIWALRRVLLDHRALLVRYGALIRFVTPGFLVLVLLAGTAVVASLSATRTA